jgi:YtkA-like
MIGKLITVGRRPAVAGRWVLALALMVTSCGGGSAPANMTELQRLRSGTMDVVVLSPREGLQHGKDTFLIEFRSTSNGNLTDVGDVRASATMPMPGMPMFGSIDVQRTDVAGRYRASGEFSMAGAWRVTIEWNGTDGRSSVSFTGNVQ